MPELKPCPFCGGEAKIIDLPEEYNTGGIAVECQKCRASSICCFPVKDDPRPHVIIAWNTRPDSELKRLAREVLTVWNGIQWSKYSAMVAYQLKPHLNALAAYLDKEGTK